MVQILAGGKGEGKTKRLIEMANNAVKETNGCIVYIDDDSRHIYDLDHAIRFVEIAEFPLVTYRELISFVYGIISQNNDIEKIYIDGIFKIVSKMNSEDLIKLVTRFKSIGEKYSIDFIASANTLPTDLPKEIADVIMA